MNTKSILRYTAATLAALAVLACSKDDTAEPGTPETPDTTAPFTITATMDDAPETRISATDDGSSKIELKWQVNDKIYVVNSSETGTASAGTLYKFIAQSISADGKTASFTAPAGYEGMPAYAAYAGTLSSFFNPASIGIGIGAYKTSASGLPEIYPLYAAYDAETRQLKFKPLFAVLKLNVTLPEGASGALSRLRIGSEDGSEIFYYGSYDITSGEAVRKSSSVANKIIQSGSSPFTGNTEQSVYLSVNPGTELTGKELEIDLIVGTSVYTATVKGAKLEAGKCYPLTLGAAKWTYVGKIYEGGTGDTETPYQIANETNLRALARAVRAANGYDGKYFKLTGDISGIQTSEAEPWLPIGTSGNPLANSFDGNFDGNGHTVSGTFHLSDKDRNCLGFFGKIDGSKLSNLTLKGDVIYNSSSSTNTYPYLGGIAGYCSGEISGCTRSDGTITANAPNAFVYAGGIAGQLDRSSTVMHTCRNECAITVTGKVVYAGALVGYNRSTVYGCSTFPDNLAITVNGTPQNPAKAIGTGNSVDETSHTD